MPLTGRGRGGHPFAIASGGGGGEWRPGGEEGRREGGGRPWLALRLPARPSVRPSVCVPAGRSRMESNHQQRQRRRRRRVVEEEE